MKQKRQNQHSPKRATLTKILREGYDTPPLNEHNKAEYPPMHNGEFNTSPIAIYTSEDNTISLDVKLEIWKENQPMKICTSKIMGNKTLDATCTTNKNNYFCHTDF